MLFADHFVELLLSPLLGFWKDTHARTKIMFEAEVVPTPPLMRLPVNEATSAS
jgi:hypothetical protein